MFSPRYWAFFAVVAAAIGYAMLKPTDSDPMARADTAPGCSDTAPWNCVDPDSDALIVSPADPFGYEYLQLDNGLRVLLVSTPGRDKAAAAMTVAVGSGDDPENRQGLAHFLEHMLFLGTEPYPEAGEYQAYISRHGGSHNAFTAHQQTTYFFSVDNEAMAGALDRFAPFFISPTFDSAYVDREKNAVNAEYTAKIRDDFRRIYSAEKQAYNPDHPFSHFSVGNLDTLADRPDSRIRDELLSFYRNHYSADQMTLVLAGNHSLEQLREWATSHFQDVPNREVKVASERPPLFAPGQLPLDLTVEPVKEIRRLQFTFPMPESQSLYEHKPLQLLASLIGHEGYGSLLALLKEKGWAEGLSAGRSLNTRYEANLVVQISLTRMGLLYTDQITRLLEHYFSLLKSQPLPDYLMKEQQQLNEISFRFMEHGSLSDYAVRLSSNLQLYPPQQVIHGDYLAMPVAQSALQPYLDALDMNNVLRTLIAPGVPTELTDPWYNTPMRLRPMNYQRDGVQQEDLAQLHLPEPNPFIPESFGLNQEPAQPHPQQLIDQAGQTLWYYPEKEFRQPRSRIVIDLQHAANAEPLTMVTSQLYVRAVNEALNTFSYPAQLAGIGYNLRATTDGFRLVLSGYQDKLPTLLERVIDTMQSVTLSEGQFERYKASLQRNLENALKSKPYERGLAELKQWIHTPSHSEVDLLEVLGQVQRTDVEAMARNLPGQTANTLYVHGSMSLDDAKALSDQLQQAYPGDPEQVRHHDVLRLPAGSHGRDLALDHEDEVMVLYLQGTNNSDDLRARVALLGQMISAPYYQYMRTEQQLGYIVFGSAFPQRSVPGLIFIVQSPDTQPAELMSQSRIFWQNYQQTLAEMSEEEFASFKEGLISKLLEPARNMSEKSDRFWAEIDIGRHNFDTNQAIADAVRTLTLTDIQTLYQQWIIDAEAPRLLFTQGETVDMPSLDTIERNQQTGFSVSE